MPAPRKMRPPDQSPTGVALSMSLTPEAIKTLSARLHRHHHHGSAQEGPAKRLDAGLASAAAGTDAAGRAGLYAALRAGARGSGDAGILVVADLDPDRDRSHAGRLHRRGRRHGRHRRRHFRRHSVRPHGQARGRGAGHRRRRARSRRRARHRPAGVVRRLRGAALGRRTDLRRLGRADRLRRRRDFPERHHRRRPGRRGGDPAGVARPHSGRRRRAGADGGLDRRCR